MQSEKHSVDAGLLSCYPVPVSSGRTFLQSREYIAFSPHSVFSSCQDSWQGGRVLLVCSSSQALALASLRTVSISLVVTYSLISSVSLSLHLIRCASPILWSPPIAGCVAAPSPLREYGPTPSRRYPSKSPLHGGFLRAHGDCLLSEAVLCSCFYLSVIAWEPET